MDEALALVVVVDGVVPDDGIVLGIGNRTEEQSPQGEAARGEIDRIPAGG
jgi:hypothetical protein